MKVEEYVEYLLFEERYEDKILPPDTLVWSEKYSPDKINFKLPTKPGRSKKIDFSDKKIKFPRKESLNIELKKAQALNSFANHELLAVEMMACAILLYPHSTEEELRAKKGVLHTLYDEQKHLKLYVDRLNELGYEFGDFPLNDFFWKQMASLETFEQYFAVMALTFEAANLDFALYYRDIFLEFDDKKTSDILDIVYREEISHVSLGVAYLNRWRQDRTLWNYYQELLPFPITPQRSKGIVFNEESRVKSKLDQDFIDNLKNYDDSFKITQRKTWK